jgi:eukaryotic-like serine/threonine-protein kinase
MSDGNTATAKPDPLIGRVIADRFRIVSLIARGGMGKVYLAEQAPLGRHCAVKVLNPNYNGDADPEFHRRFFREASIASRITHPNSVTIFDYGKTDDDVYYMAMEYLEGQTLHQAIRESGTMPEERVGRIAQQVCRGLREAHALDVIHRDLKPANLMLTRHDDAHDFVKILDFGLVKHLSERPEEQLTQTGLFMGSPKYMAPEQIQGGHVDARTDVYSLGIIMYEMLAGKVPFDRPTSVNILMAHVGEPPPPMREVNPNLVCSPAMEELVMRCIAKDPAERWSSMDEVLQAIKHAHGVSMTGQLAALTSGAFSPVATLPPPAVRTSSAMVPVLAHGAQASGSHTPMGILSSEVSGETGGSMGIEAPRRSRAWIAVGVLVAAVIGGLLGMVAFRVTGGVGAAPAATGSATTSAAAEPVSASSAEGGETEEPGEVASSTPGALPSAPAETSETVRVTSTPPGATVREDGTELCPATPCDVALAGEGDAARTHTLLVSKPGYRTEPRTVAAGQRRVDVKLTRATGGSPRPSGPSAPEPRPSTPTATGTAAPTPSGFKDLPY